MKKKRLLSSLLCLILALAMLTGCGAAQAAPTADSAPAAQEAQPAAPAEEAAEAAPSARLTLDEADELARLMPNDTDDVMFLMGTWHEMGAQYANGNLKGIKLQIERVIGNRLSHYGTLDAAIEASAGSRTEYEAILPEILELFDGIAEVTGYTKEEVFLGMTSIGGGCNSSAAWGDGTQGDIYAAVNSDGPDASGAYYEPILVLYPQDAAYPEDTIPVMSWHGILSNGIVNEAGVMYTLTQGQDAVEGDIAENVVVPHYIALVEAVRNDTAAQALKGFTDYLDNNSSTQPSNVMVIDAAGEGYVIEMTNTEYAVREQNKSYEGDRDYFIFNNMFESEEMDHHNTYDGTWDDCPYRYETVKYFFERDYGHINAETMREAMACQTYVDVETGKMSEEVIYENSPRCYYSPENVAANEKSTGRMIADLSTMEAFILNGDEDARMSIFPDATGVYRRLCMRGTPADITADAKDYAQLYMFQAIRDLADEGDAPAREAELNACKEAYFEGVNYLKLAGGFTGAEQLSMYSRAASAFLRAQAHAKLAWDTPNRIYSDYDGAGYIF